MNPVAQRKDHRSKGDLAAGRRFPLIDFNYQSFSFDRFYGGGRGERPNSFFDISRDYFAREAGRNFAAEVAFFLVMAAILAGAFVEGARAIIHFLHLPPA